MFTLFLHLEVMRSPVFPISIKPREQQIFLLGKYRLIYPREPQALHFNMAITPRLLCVPTVVIIFAALVISFLTSLSLPAIPTIPIVRTTLGNGTFVVNGTNSQSLLQELRARFFPYLISCCSSFHVCTVLSSRLGYGEASQA